MLEHGPASIGQLVQAGVRCWPDLLEQPLIFELRQPCVHVGAIAVELQRQIRRNIPPVCIEGGQDVKIRRHDEFHIRLYILMVYTIFQQ